MNKLLDDNMICINFNKRNIKMKKQTETKLFAFKLAEKNEQAAPKSKWTARKGVATAGCSGPWARSKKWGSRTDDGIWC
jgi:hypothetical protein